MDAHTGELLALANYPSFDPGNRKNLTGEQLRNRAITDVFEPGSTVKPITVAMALESGSVRPDDLDRHLARALERHRLHHLRYAQLRRAHGGRRDSEVQQRGCHQNCACN